jgi:hypothetical protein
MTRPDVDSRNLNNKTNRSKMNISGRILSSGQGDIVCYLYRLDACRERKRHVRTRVALHDDSFFGDIRRRKIVILYIATLLLALLNM